MANREITFTSAGYTLAGTLTVPDKGSGPYPAALLVTGSGPLDRDSNMKRLDLNVTRDLAAHLAAAGVATLRFDKRGAGASEGDFHETGFYDNVADAAAAVATLRSNIDCGSVYVVGHSEGALIAAELAAADPTIDGIVLLAGAARSGRDVLLYQADQASAILPRPVRALMRLLRQDVRRSQAKKLARIEASTDPVIRIQGVRLNAKWFREFMALDPRATLPHVAAPILAITGDKDFQVPPEDLAGIAASGGGPVETHLIADLTHILRKDPAAPSLRAYKKLAKQPTDPDVMELVGRWIMSHRAAQNAP